MRQICSLLGTRKTKRHLASVGGGLRPFDLQPEALPPGPPLRSPSPDPPCRLALRARHGIRTLCSSKLIFKKALHEATSDMMPILCYCLRNTL